MSNKSIAKSASIIGGATLLSRILGFVRMILIARLLGTSRIAEAFFVAFRIPNLIRNLAGEGAANSTVVPVLSGYLHKEKHEFWRLVYVLFTLFLLILGFFVVLGMFFAPLIVRVIAPGFISDPDKLDLTIRLSRIMFPYLILIGISALGMGVLNTLKSFAVSAFGPCIFNLAFIASILVAYNKNGNPTILALGVLIAGVLQLLIQIPVLVRYGFRPKLTELHLKHKGAASIGKLLIPRMIGSGVYLLNVFIDTILASLSWIVGVGGVAAIYYANRLIQFPLGIFSFAISNAALPAMSTHAAAGEIDQLKSILSFSLRSVFLFTIPSAVGLAVLAGPIIRVLFERGEFNAYSTLITSSALLFYSLGIPAYAAVKILTSCFYALKDTKTPVKSAAVALIVNTVFNLILIWHLKIGGLALASSIASFVNAFILYRLLRKKIGKLFSGEILSTIMRIIAASGLMGVFMFFLRSNLTGLSENIALILTIVLSVPSFFIFCLLFGVDEIKSIWRIRKN
ncbi:MAG TPA: murein biosynthesis integral membrane protein MurJ [Candidatus Omnitrophica bacterium]|nr:murein biosynthesis integral membrane protein MurJ [Candidatus Omnitrophota bacterium]